MKMPPVREYAFSPISGQTAMKEEMKTFKKEIADSVEFQSKEIKELKEAKGSMETNNKNQWDYLFAHRNYIQTLTDELNKVERYTRKNNFRIIRIS